MATLSASTGQVLSNGDTTNVQNPYDSFVAQMGNLMTMASQNQTQGNTAINAANQGLTTAQAGFGTPGSTANPFNSLYAFMPASSYGSMSDTLGGIYNPTILSQENQAKNMTANTQTAVQALEAQQTAAIAAQAALKNAGIGRYSTGVFPGTLTQFTYDSVTGQYSDQFGNPIKTSKTDTPPNTTRMVGTINSGAYGATDPEYDTKLKNNISAVSSQMPNGYDPTIADAILKSHHSTLTSAMISLAANQYGLNPIDLLGQISLESTFGTSPVATKNNNPGGVMWVGQAGASQGTPRPASEGGFYAEFKSMQDGLYAMAKIAGTKPTPVTPVASADPITSLAQQVISGDKSPSDAFSIAGGMTTGGAIALNTLLNSMSPNGKFDQSAAQAKYDAKQTNTGIGNTLQPLVDATSGVINGNSNVPSIQKLYDSLPSSAQTNSSFGYIAAKVQAETSTNLKKFGLGGNDTDYTAIQQWESSATDLRAKANSVLLAAQNLGVKTGGDTAESLFPLYTTKAGLTASIAKIQEYEKQAIAAYKGGSQTETDISSLRTKYGY